MITGTDTGVGKTIATAALASALAGFGAVAVYKPVQTGVVSGESGDVDEVRRLSGVHEATSGMSLRKPLAPVPAAALEGVGLPTISEHAARIASLHEKAEWVLVEGSGGVLVELDSVGGTIADIGRFLSGDYGVTVVAVIVVRAGLGTLNHTALTVEALDRRGIAIAAVVIGSWPDQPDTIEVTNREHLARTHALDALPGGAAQLEPARFRSAAVGWLPGVLAGVGATS